MSTTAEPGWSLGLQRAASLGDRINRRPDLKRGHCYRTGASRQVPCSPHSSGLSFPRWPGKGQVRPHRCFHRYRHQCIVLSAGATGLCTARLREIPSAPQQHGHDPVRRRLPLALVFRVALVAAGPQSTRACCHAADYADTCQPPAFRLYRHSSLSQLSPQKSIHTATPSGRE